jgi:RNA polymerase sigma-70 factor (ECF subfamily)
MVDMSPATAARPSPRDDETLRRAQAGDTAAFGDLLREHEAMVFGMARHFMRNDAEAEELAQDVFLELFRSLARLDSPAHVTAWLRRVTTHRCVDWARRAARREITVEVLPDRGAPGSVGDVFLARRLRQGVARLSPLPRMVVILRYQEDLDPSEIAHALEMPINTVKSHLRRAVETLRARLGAAKEPL